MKILIISDVHHDTEMAKAVIEANSDSECLIFLGDGFAEMEKLSLLYPAMGFIGVKGNCDFFPFDAPVLKTVTFGKIKIFMCHGHKFSVKQGISTLVYYAKKESADLILYGHTHRPCKGEFVYPDGKKSVFFNPGSIGDPRGGSSPSYGILEIFEKDGKQCFNIHHVTV